MHCDQFALPLTIHSQDALVSWNKCVLAFLQHGSKTPDYLQATLSQDENFALAHAVRGLMLLLLAKRELVLEAHKSLRKAKEIARAIKQSKRELVYVDALEMWLEGRPSAAAACLEACNSNYPDDALMFKIGQAMRFILGHSSRMRQACEVIAPKQNIDLATHGYVLGCFAFSLEETGDYVRARSTGLAALERNPKDAWALHAVAHCYDMCGQSKEGILWLKNRRELFANCNNFSYHLWWHLALMHLDQGQYVEVLDLYDTKVRAEHTDDFRDISNAASLLLRLELEGIDVGARWQELTEISEHRLNDMSNMFASLHYLTSLLAGGEQTCVEQLQTCLSQFAHNTSDELGATAKLSALPEAYGLAHFSHGNYLSAYHYMAQARPNLIRIGGSHAQRDIFERIIIESALRAGLITECRSLLEDRRRYRGGDDHFGRTRLTACERMTEQLASPLYSSKMRTRSYGHSFGVGI